MSRKIVLEERVRDKDPAGKIENLLDRSILILHGESDSMVEITPQREIYEKLMSSYTEKENLKMTSYPMLDHFVTTNMLEEMGEWFGENLKGV